MGMVLTNFAPRQPTLRHAPRSELLTRKHMYILIILLCDELYSLAKNLPRSIGATVLGYPLPEFTTDWQFTKDIFISSTIKDPPLKYEHGLLRKIFTSKGREHDGAVILSLRDGFIYSDSNLFPLIKDRKQSGEQKEKRGTRHASAEYLSNFTTAPIIVVSDEKKEVSLFCKGVATYGIDKDSLISKLLKACQEQEETCPAYTVFNRNCFINDFSTTLIPEDDNFQWYFYCFKKTHMELHRGATFELNGEEITVTPDRPDDCEKARQLILHNATEDLELYKNNILQCDVFKHGDKLLGGIFYYIPPFDHTTIIMINIFILPQLLHDKFAAELIREVFCKKKHPYCKRIEFCLPSHLITRFAGLLKALNAKPAPGLIEKYRFIYSQPRRVLEAFVKPEQVEPLKRFIEHLDLKFNRAFSIDISELTSVIPANLIPTKVQITDQDELD